MYKIVLLDSTHDREKFDCTNESLNKYLKTQASQDVKKKLAACFVMVNKNNEVKGFYTLSNASIPKEDLPFAISKTLPRNYDNPPTTLLGRLAIDKSIFGEGIGQVLLTEALKRSYYQSEVIGSMAVIVDPIDENAIKFYEKFGFIRLDSGKMSLPMQKIKKLVEMHK